jgi:uncharacterized protein
MQWNHPMPPLHATNAGFVPFALDSIEPAEQLQTFIANNNVDAARVWLSRYPESANNIFRLYTRAERQACCRPPIKAFLLAQALSQAVKENRVFLAKDILAKGANPRMVDARLCSPRMAGMVTNARRRAMLYPQGVQAGRGYTVLDAALAKGRDADAHFRLKLYGDPSRNAAQMWRDAIKDRRPDILRGLLLLGYAAADPGFRLLQTRPVEDPAIKAVMKEIPSYSPKRGAPLALNCKAKFLRDNEEIVCRHLAAHHLTVQANHPQIKFDYTQFGDIDRIAKNVGKETDAAHDRLKMRANEVHLFANQRFGQFIAAQFTAMESKGQDTKLILLTTGSHAMTAGLRIKQKPDGSTSYVLRFFDPNRTTNVLRCRKSNIGDFAFEGIDTYLKKDAISAYYPDQGTGVSMAFVVPGTRAGRHLLHAYTPLIRSSGTAIDPAEASPAMLNHLMTYGMADDLYGLKDELQRRNDDERTELLAAKDRRGYPGLYMAMLKNQSASVSVMGELIKLAPENHRAGLLAAESPHGTTALYAAMAGKKWGVVSRYIDIVNLISPTLTGEARRQLLATIKKSYGTSIFRGMFKLQVPYDFYLEMRKQQPRLHAQFETMMQSLEA